MPYQIHSENPPENRCTLRRTKLAFSVFILIVVCGLGKAVAAAHTTPNVGFSPTVDSFGNRTVGTISANQPIKLSNTGKSALSISSLALTGTNAGDFAQSNNCGASVAAGAYCTINVTFRPTATGTRTAAITLTDNAAGSPQTVALIGTSTAPVVSLSPSTLAFAGQSVGATSAAQAIQLFNTGNSALSISSLALTGANASDFAQSNNCGSSVAAGSHCTINVTFTPTASGSRTAAVTLTDNATGSPQAVTLTGTGSGAPPTVSFSPTSDNFGNQAVGAIQWESAHQAVQHRQFGLEHLRPHDHRRQCRRLCAIQ